MSGQNVRAGAKRRNPGIAKTDRLVWEAFEESKTEYGADITFDSAASILSLAVQKGSGMSPEESLKLAQKVVKSIRQ